MDDIDTSEDQGWGSFPSSGNSALDMILYFILASIVGSMVWDAFKQLWTIFREEV